MKKLLILSVLFTLLSSVFFSCRTVKKEFLKENYVAKSTHKATTDSITYEMQSIERRAEQGVLSILEQQSQFLAQDFAENEKQTQSKINDLEVRFIPKLDSLGNLVDTYYRSGNTTIETRGAEVIYKVIENTTQSNERTASEKAEQQYNNETFSEIKSTFERQKSEIQFLMNKVSFLESQLEEKKQMKSKEVKKSNLPWWLWIALGLFAAVAALILLFYKKVKTPFKLFT